MVERKNDNFVDYLAEGYGVVNTLLPVVQLLLVAAESSTARQNGIYWCVNAVGLYCSLCPC